MPEYNVEQITLHWMYISAIVFYLIYLPVRMFCQRLALKRIKDNLNKDEYIVYEPKLKWVIELIVPIATGGFFGGFILPFFVYKDITHIDRVPREYLPACVLAEMVMLFLIFTFCCRKFVITNQRFTCALSHKFIYRIYKEPININLSNIDHMKITYKFINQFLIIYFKDKKQLKIASFRNFKKIKDIIENQLDTNV